MAITILVFVISCKYIAYKIFVNEHNLQLNYGINYKEFVKLGLLELPNKKPKTIRELKAFIKMKEDKAIVNTGLYR